MSRRFSERPLKSTDRLSHDTLNPLFVKLDTAVAALEELRLNWEEQILQFNTNGLKRVSDAIQPLVSQLNSAIDGGFLVATTDDLVEIAEGEEVSFYIPPASRVAFRPTPFLAIMAPDDVEDWALAQTLAYDDNTGLLVVNILYLNGSGDEREGWTVAASSGVVEAVYQWMTDVTAMRDEVAADQETVAADKAVAVAAAAAAVPAATTATTQAGIATTKAAEAAASAASIAGGPVASVNGLTGIVTGILETSHIGTTVQGRDADLDAIAALSPANDNVMQRKAGAWVDRTPTQLLTDLAAVGAATIAAGVLTVSATSSAPSEIRLLEDTDNGAHYVGLKAPAIVAANTVFELPAADGLPGQILQTNGSKVFSFVNQAPLQFVQAQSATGASAIDFTAGFDSDHDLYFFHLIGLYPGTDVETIECLISEDGGSNYHSSGYSRIGHYSQSNTINALTGSESASSITLASQMDNSADNAMFGRIYVHVTTTKVVVEGQVFADIYDGSAGRVYNVGGTLATTSRANGLRLRAGSGNISGLGRQYRIRNS
jgi:hypothetical protein